MKVPEYIKKEMTKVWCFSCKSQHAMYNVETWLRKKGFSSDDIEQLRDGSGCGLEELEYGNNIENELSMKIEKIWREKHGKEN